MKSFVKNYLQPSFLLSVACLLFTAGFISYFKAYQGITLIKKPLPLKQPFDVLDEKLLEPYKVIDKSKISKGGLRWVKRRSWPGAIFVIL